MNDDILDFEKFFIKKRDEAFSDENHWYPVGIALRGAKSTPNKEGKLQAINFKDWLKNDQSAFIIEEDSNDFVVLTSVRWKTSELYW